MARAMDMLLAAIAFAFCRNLVAAAADVRSCPQPSGAVSPDSAGQKVTVTFSSDLDAALDMYWVDPRGGEKLLDPVSRTIETFQGHLFRIFGKGPLEGDVGRTLLLEYAANAKTVQDVTIETCREFEAVLHAAGSQADALARSDEFEALVHERVTADDFAPCGPEGESHKWSCVRRLPRDVCEDRHRNVPSATEGREFGFQRPQGEWKAGAFEDRQFDWQQDLVPQLSDGHGFLKMNMTNRLRNILVPWYKERVAMGLVEAERPVTGGYMNNIEVRNDLVSLDKDVPTRTAIVREMGQVLEWWTKGSNLQHHSTYGVRVYRRNATLLNHVDRLATHLASAIVQVDQSVDKDGGWPVEVLSIDRDCFEVYLQPGEMLLYEGARYAHGRPMRFRGDLFANVFTHFSPKSWKGVSLAARDAEL